MTVDVKRASCARLAELVGEVDKRLLALPGDDRGDYVGSELETVDRVLSRIRTEQLAHGTLFCEWGSGLGGVCGVAALNGFSPVGIEIRPDLVDSARQVAKQLDLPMNFAAGTFMLPGDEDLAVGTVHTHLSFNAHAWEALEVVPEACDVVFAYPWPGEEACVDGVFSRHASVGALLLTFHDRDKLLVQRKVAEGEELLTLGWM